MITAAATGFAAGLSLILAIGAQNAFVLRQGLRRSHVFWICLICAGSDAILVSIGVAGFGALSQRVPWLEPVIRYGGAAFLIWYGARSFRAALRPRSLAQSAGAAWRHFVALSGRGSLGLWRRGRQRIFLLFLLAGIWRTISDAGFRFARRLAGARCGDWGRDVGHRRRASTLTRPATRHPAETRSSRRKAAYARDKPMRRHARSGRRGHTRTG